jgi:hypothetical protein
LPGPAETMNVSTLVIFMGAPFELRGVRSEWRGGLFLATLYSPLAPTSS